MLITIPTFPNGVGRDLGVKICKSYSSDKHSICKGKFNLLFQDSDIEELGMNNDKKFDCTCG